MYRIKYCLPIYGTRILKWLQNGAINAKKIWNK
jgi:hypothetical protein